MEAISPWSGFTSAQLSAAEGKLLVLMAAKKVDTALHSHKCPKGFALILLLELEWGPHEHFCCFIIALLKWSTRLSSKLFARKIKCPKLIFEHDLSAPAAVTLQRDIHCHPAKAAGWLMRTAAGEQQPRTLENGGGFKWSSSLSRGSVVGLLCVCALSGGNKNARSLHSPAPKCATQQPPSLSFISQINTHQFNTRQPPVAEVRAETAAEMNIFLMEWNEMYIWNYGWMEPVLFCSFHVAVAPY